MRIEEIYWQHRRDFMAVYKCPFCGNTEKHNGYDDSNFHENVIPKMKCSKCGKSELDGNKNYRPLTTKYPDYKQV